jgi:hypothetical protein
MSAQHFYFSEDGARQAAGLLSKPLTNVRAAHS